MDDIEVLVPNDTEFEFVTPTQTYIIKTGIKMSEDGDEPETDYNFYSPMTSYGIDDQHKTMVNEMTLKTGSSNSTFWASSPVIDGPEFIQGGNAAETPNAPCSNDTWQFNGTQLKILMFNNIKWEIQHIVFLETKGLFLPAFSEEPNYTQTQHTLKIAYNEYGQWVDSSQIPSTQSYIHIYDKTTDTFYGTTKTKRTNLETALSGNNLLYYIDDATEDSLYLSVDNNDNGMYIQLACNTEPDDNYYYKLEHASVYITELQEL